MKAYRFLAYLIALEVVVQASALAFGVFGEGRWVEKDGGVVNKALIDAQDSSAFTGAVGFAIHGINGTMIIPLLVIALLVTSLVARFPGGVKQAGIVLGLVVVQVTLGILSHEVVGLGPLHAINAFLVLWSALAAARLAGGTLFSRRVATA